jgi:uncharacterized phosphosugar-binding protein
VAAVCAESIRRDGLLYFFGTGHAHMMCEEPFYRAGGLACVHPILEPNLMLHAGARKSSDYERVEGIGNIAIGNSGVSDRDVLFVISNSGRNSAVIDAASEGMRRGAVTVAVTSLRHAAAVTSRHSSGKKLHEVCDFVLDNGGEAGDASVTLSGLPQKIAPTSSVIGATLINLILVNTVERLLENGETPAVFTSANVDHGDEANRAILDAYQNRVRTL